MSRQFSQPPSRRTPTTPANGAAASNGLNGNGSSDLYQQLIDSNDLVKELDDIEAISQQISQHAEVLYQNWKTNSQPREAKQNHYTASQSQPHQPQKVASSSTTYGAGVGFPKRSILENGVKNGNGLEEAKKVSPLSSPTATLTSPGFIKQKIDLMPPPEVNGNLKDLVNSFVSTDRAKQAARQTISSTITNQMNKRNNVRSPSPTSSTTSSTFSSRGVSPLRSPGMLAGSNGPAPPERRLMDAFPTNASIMNSVHTKMPPMFNNQREPTSPLVPNSAGSGAPVIRIPVQHVKTEEPPVYQPPAPPLATPARRPPELTLRTPAMLQQQNSMTNLHAQHVEQMKKRFEEAKERISAMQARAASGMPAFLNSPPVDFTGADEVDFFNRLRRRDRPLLGPPHPELTPQQKAHISERGTSENGQAIGQNVAPPKRFGGSVADRVMLFERCPIVNSELKDNRLATTEKRPTTNSVPPWRNIQQPQVS